METIHNRVGFNKQQANIIIIIIMQPTELAVAACVTPDSKATSKAKSRREVLLLEGTNAARASDESTPSRSCRSKRALNAAIEKAGADDSDDDISVSSACSIRRNHGRWGNDPIDVPWHGCVCGQVHERPTKVFWIQCDVVHCQAWYNVASDCIDGLTAEQVEADPNMIWICRSCNNQQQEESQHALTMFLHLPPELWMRILEWTASPTFRAAVLCHQIAPLNKRTKHFVLGRNTSNGCAGSKELWNLLLQRDYHHHHHQQQQQQHMHCSLSKVEYSRNGSGNGNGNGSVRISKRQRRISVRLSPPTSTTAQRHPRLLVEEQHLAMLGRTEEAYHRIETLADPFKTTASLSSSLDVESPVSTLTTTAAAAALTLARLRSILQQNAPLNINRVSPFSGRTMLQVVCASEMSERNLVECVRFLVKHHHHYHHQAHDEHYYNYRVDPNICSTQEAPYVDRPALYFAIARVMPSLVRVLIVEAGAQLNVRISGRVRRTFDNGRHLVLHDATPLQYAQALWRVEVEEDKVVSPYWTKKLKNVIQVLLQLQKK